ncbi:MAG: hypothetical protein IJ072_03160 [Oscillospiraceae bacterium]|nr:hypothetical protein [Oscillospiraceae bacterium]
MEKRELFSCEVRTSQGHKLTLKYHVTARASSGGKTVYGVCVTVPETRESCVVDDLSVSFEAVADFARRLCEGSVTPSTLTDIVDDSLGISI